MWAAVFAWASRLEVSAAPKQPDVGPAENETGDRGIRVGAAVAEALKLVCARRHGCFGFTEARCAVLSRALANQLNRRSERGCHAG